MFQYKIDILQALKDKGYNTNRIRKEHLLNENALQYIRDNKMLGMKPLDTICTLLDCQLSDIIEHVPDPQD